MSKMGSNLLQVQSIIPNLVASLPFNNTNRNPQINATSEFNHSDHKPPLSLPHELMPMPNAKPFNNMPTGTVFPRSLSPSSSPSLQLNSHSLNNMFEENGIHLAAGLPHMSATALLQKAAQMGANVGNTNGVTEKSFVTSMAPASFGSVPSNGIMEQYMQNAQQDISSQYNFNVNGMDGSGGMNGVDMFNAILDQSKALSKIIEQNSRSSNGVLFPLSGSSSSTFNIGGTKGSEDVMTLDLLGIGVGGGGGGGGAHGYFGPLN